MIKRRKIFFILILLGFSIVSVTINIQLIHTMPEFNETNTMNNNALVLIEGNGYDYFDLGDLIEDTHTVDLSYTSQLAVDSWFMNYDDLQNWLADTTPYAKYNIEYSKTSRSVDNYNPDFNDNWFFVIENNNAGATFVNIEWTVHRTGLIITNFTLIEGDSDYDGYNDSLLVSLTVASDTGVLIDYNYEIEYTYQADKSGYPTIVTVDGSYFANYWGQMVYNIEWFRPDIKVKTTVGVKVTTIVNDGSHPSDIETLAKTSNQLYYQGYKGKMINTILLSTGIPIGVIIVGGIVTVVIMKKKRVVK